MNSKLWIPMALTLGLWTGSARAQDDVLDAESDLRFREGLAALKADKCEQARASFLQTLAVTPEYPKVMLNLAISEHCAGRYAQALGHLKMYFANPKSDPQKVAELKDGVYKQLWQLTGHLKISANRGESVTVDGEVKGYAPLGDVVDVQPGNRLVASEGRTLEVTVAAGETKEVNVASSTAVAVTPAVPPAQQTKESYWTGQHVTGVTLGGLAVVAAGLGIGFLAARESHVTDTKSIADNPNACADPTSGPCRQFGDARSSAKTAGVVSGVSFVAAGALAVGAVVLLVPWQKKEGARVSARLVPTGQGVLLDGAF